MATAHGWNTPDVLCLHSQLSWHSSSLWDLYFRYMMCRHQHTLACEQARSTPTCCSSA